MSVKYRTIKIKEESMVKLKKAVSQLNEKGQYEKVTLAGLVSQLANSYERHMDTKSLLGNREKWITDGVPVILDSDAAKHYAELKMHYPEDCSVIISNYIRSMAMEARFAFVEKNHG